MTGVDQSRQGVWHTHLTARQGRATRHGAWQTGGLTPDAVAEGTHRVWEWIKTGQLHADIEQMPLKDVERAWKRTDLHGARIVLIP